MIAKTECWKTWRAEYESVNWDGEVVWVPITTESADGEWHERAARHYSEQHYAKTRVLEIDHTAVVASSRTFDTPYPTKCREESLHYDYTGEVGG